MRRSIPLVIPLATAGLLLVALGGSATLAAAPAKAPTRAELADQLLKSRAGGLMTASARLGLAALVRGDSRLGPEAGGTAATLPQRQIKFGPNLDAQLQGLDNVRVNNPGEDVNQMDQTTQSETAIAQSGSNLVVGFNDSQHALLFPTAGASLDGFAYSGDGGKTFVDGGWIPNHAGNVNLGDPWITQDSTGAMYYSSLTIDYSRFALLVGVARSTDNGKTWGTLNPIPPPVNAAFYSADKDAITGSGTNLYAVWDDFTFQQSGPPMSGLPVAHSTDGGQTWSISYADQVPLFGSGKGGGGGGCSFAQYIGAQPLVSPDGTVVYDAAEKLEVNNPTCVFPPPAMTQSIWIFASFDGGDSWPQRAMIAGVGSSTQGVGYFLLAPGKAMRNLEFPTLAAQGSNLYATWNDGSTGHSHIMLGTSTDGGITWTTSSVTSGSNDEAQPSITADSAGIHIFYYRISASGGEGVLNARVSNSTNGTTWSVRRVSSQSFPGVLTLPQFDPILAFTYMGDYVASTTDGVHQYFAWGDNRNTVTNWLYPQGRNDPDVFFAKQ